MKVNGGYIVIVGLEPHANGVVATIELREARIGLQNAEDYYAITYHTDEVVKDIVREMIPIAAARN